MQTMSWKCLALIAIAMCTLAMAVPVPQETSDALSPVAADEGTQSEVDREKRKIFGPDVGFGVKNAVLGYVFGDASERDVTKTSPVHPVGVTDDTPSLDRQQGTARRYAEFMQYFKPLLGKSLIVKGLYPPPAKTETPMTITESSKAARSLEVEVTTMVAPRLIRVTRAAPVLPPGVTDDTPDFNRESVMLDIPDELFGNSFTIITNISKVVSDLMMNSARRYANFVQYFKPLLGKALTVKGLYPPPPTTEAPTTTEKSNEAKSVKESNKI